MFKLVKKSLRTQARLEFKTELDFYFQAWFVNFPKELELVHGLY